MADAPEGEQVEQEEGEVLAATPMFSKSGLIVYAVSMVVIIGAFVVLQVMGKPSEPPKELEEKKAHRSVMDLNGPRLAMEKPIIVSVPTNELATEFRHLAITLTIVFGRLEHEYHENFNLTDTLTNEQFLETAEKFTPYVEDRVNRVVSSYTYLALQQTATKTEMSLVLRKELNDLLKEYNMNPRVTEVLITSFIFSD